MKQLNLAYDRWFCYELKIVNVWPKIVDLTPNIVMNEYLLRLSITLFITIVSYKKLIKVIEH